MPRDRESSGASPSARITRSGGECVIVLAEVNVEEARATPTRLPKTRSDTSLNSSCSSSREREHVSSLAGVAVRQEPVSPSSISVDDTEFGNSTLLNSASSCVNVHPSRDEKDDGSTHSNGHGSRPDFEEERNDGLSLHNLPPLPTLQRQRGNYWIHTSRRPFETLPTSRRSFESFLNIDHVSRNTQRSDGA